MKGSAARSARPDRSRRRGLPLAVSARFAVAAAVASAALVRGLPAQEMEPRAYSSSPVGMNFVAAAVGNTSGSILFDPTLPIEDVHSDMNLATLGYARTFALAGRQGLAAIGVPYARGDIEG